VVGDPRGGVQDLVGRNGSPPQQLAAAPADRSPAVSSRAVVLPEPRRPVRFCATPGGTRIAYSRTGTGPALLVPAAWISHLELLWQDPAYRAFCTPLAAVRTVVQYDRPGCGLSEPWPQPQDLDTDVAVLRAVADHLGLGRFDLLGISLGAPASVAFAARFPERVGRWSCTAGTPTAGSSPRRRCAPPCST